MNFGKRWQAVLLAVIAIASGIGFFAANPSKSGALDQCDNSAAKRYVADGDGVVYGTDLDNDGTSPDDRYSNVILTKYLQTYPGWGDWCMYNLSADPTDTDTFVFGAGSQQSQTWNLKPLLITLTLGRQNNVIVDHVTKCLQNIKDHDFAEANACALAVYTNTGAWDKLRKDMSSILNKFKTQMSGTPNLVVAVTGYYNPYPNAIDVITKIPEFCENLVDTVPTCVARWILLPPALVTLDQVVKKMNDTIAPVVKQFTISSQGRFFFINPYEKFKDHCTKMQVDIHTQVYHPTDEVDKHDTSKDFGCSDPWIATDKKDGTKTPFIYLTPAFDGILIYADQTTSGMGINPNKDGNACLADMIWQTVKQKMGVPEAKQEPCP